MDLDRLAAEKVMGWVRYEKPAWIYYTNRVWLMPDGEYFIREFTPTTNIEHAFMLVDVLRADGWRFELFDVEVSEVMFNRYSSERGIEHSGARHVERPMAITLASLRALGVEV